MTAPAQLSKHPVARDSELGPVATRSAAARPPCETTPTRSRPAPPAPVLPLVPPVQRPLVRRRLRFPLGCDAPQVRIRAPRLTRTVRLVVAAAVTLAVVGGVSWMDQAASPRVPAETALTWVGAGETVWDVAQRVAPKSDQRAVVERIRHLNGMADSAIQPGQQLQVPDER